MHIFFGAVGPLFIILHSTFKYNGIVSVSFCSMILVALSGVLGRYLYVQIPKTIRGTELSRKEVEQQITELSDQLARDYQFGDENILSLKLKEKCRRP